MEVYSRPGQQLSERQKNAVTKCVTSASAEVALGMNIVGSTSACHLPVKGNPLKRSDVPRLLRAMGRNPSQHDLEALLANDDTMDVNAMQLQLEQEPAMSQAELLDALRGLEIRGGAGSLLAILQELDTQAVALAFRNIAAARVVNNADQSSCRERNIPKSEIPRLLRAMGRCPTESDIKSLLPTIPSEGVDAEGFIMLLDKANAYPKLEEERLFEVLKAMDLSGSAVPSLELEQLRNTLISMGDKLSPNEVDEMLKGVPCDARGKIICRELARKLVNGPDGVKRVK